MLILGELKKMMFRRPLILDGATSTMLGRYMLPNSDGIKLPVEFYNMEKAPCDLDILTAPQAVMGLHLDYILSGADIIKTNSFNLNTITLSNFGLAEHTIFLNIKAALIAKSCAKVTGKVKKSNVIVAGTVGPSETGLSSFKTDPDLFESMRKRMSTVYADQIRGLIVGGADVILLETFYDAENLKCALDGISDLNREYDIEIPVMVSLTPGEDGRILSGETLADIVGLCRNYNTIESLGLNCGNGADAMLAPLEELSEISPYPITCHPNAGDSSKARNQTPSEFAQSMTVIASKIKLRVAGGCCGTTPSHIMALSQSLRNINYFDNIYAEGYSDN